MTTAQCIGKPPQWWDLGDEGNARALALCAGCPIRDACATGDRSAREVIRGGIAFYTFQTRIPICDVCGHPYGMSPDIKACQVCLAATLAAAPPKSERDRLRKLTATRTSERSRQRTALIGCLVAYRGRRVARPGLPDHIPAGHYRVSGVDLTAGMFMLDIPGRPEPVRVRVDRVAPVADSLTSNDTEELDNLRTAA